MSESQSLHIRLSNNRLVGLGVRDQPGSGPPRITGIGTRVAEEGQTSKWLTLVNPKVVTAPAGTAENPFSRPPHTFVQADKLIFHTSTGDVTYRVTRNPGKYDLDGNPSQAAGDPNTEVFFDYRLELED